ncbi:MAG: MBL fold metallo-hydrolase [bacterium]
MISRRHFLIDAVRMAAVARLAPLAVSNIPQPHVRTASFFRWERVHDDAWVVFNGGGNVLVIADPSGAIVIDSKELGMGQSLHDEIVARHGRIAAVVITHHHEDHSGGYGAFTNVRGIAHGSALPRIRAKAARVIERARREPAQLADGILKSLNSDFDVPRTTESERVVSQEIASFAAAAPDGMVPAESLTDRSELRIGETVLELAHAGPAHTDNDIIVRDRRRNLLHAGDLLFHRMHPFIDVSAGGNTPGWQRALDDVGTKCDGNTTVIAGHGAIGRRAALDEQRDYFSRLRDTVERARREGRTREEILKLPNDAFPAYGFADGWSENLGVILDELEKS